MGYLTEAIAAQVSGLDVRASLFVLLDFLSEPVRLWEGDGPIVRGGYQWDSLAHASVEIDGLSVSIDGAAEPLTITLSGVDPRVLGAASEDAAAGEIEGRELRVWLGFWQVGREDGALVPLDDLMHLGRWEMQMPEFGGTGPGLRTITIQAENRWVTRARATLGNLSDIDQQRRFPGDKGLEWTAALVDRKRKWPRGL